jgi:roadblock/LC7 domain-containing protein
MSVNGEKNMAMTLDELAALPGVVMAFEFTPDGTCIAHRKASAEMAAMAARYCATVTMQFGTLASAFTTLSEREWVPQRGWVYQGGAYTVIVGQGGLQGVFAETDEANLARLIEVVLRDNHETTMTDGSGRGESKQ